MDDVNIIESSDCNSNTHPISNEHLEQYLNLSKIPGLTVNSINNTNVLFVNKSTECIQYLIDCDFQLNLNVQLTIVYPKLIPIDKIKEPFRLRINVTDSKVKKEILSCTNYLQRQRNIDLAFSILRKCAISFSERKLIFNMLLLHFEGFVGSLFLEDGGITVTFEDKMSHFKLFETTWKISFNCKEHQIIDVIDFNLTTEDRAFYNKAKPLMEALTKPNLSYAKKVEIWSTIVKAANKVVLGCHVARLIRNNDIEFINSTQVEQYDISDSDDDELCMVIDDSTTEEIILN